MLPYSPCTPPGMYRPNVVSALGSPRNIVHRPGGTFDSATFAVSISENGGSSATATSRRQYLHWSLVDRHELVAGLWIVANRQPSVAQHLRQLGALWMLPDIRLQHASLALRCWWIWCARIKRHCVL